MERYVLVIHPSCPSSRSVLKTLYREGLLGKVLLLDARDPRIILEYGVWSVPWLVVDGVPVATDPLDPAEATAIIRGVYEPRIEPLEAFKNALIHSSYASAVSLLNDDPLLVVERGFVAAATRAKLAGLDVDRVIQTLVEKLPEEWDRLSDMVARALGVSFVREMFWAKEGRLDRAELVDLVKRGAVRLWLIAKASIGRGGLPHRPYKQHTSRVELIEKFVERGATGLIRKVEREYRELEEDEEYWRILDEHLTA